MKNKIYDTIRNYVDKDALADLLISETNFGYSVKIGSSVLLRIYTNMKSVFRIEFIRNADTEDAFKDYQEIKVKESVYQIDVDKKDSDLLGTIEKFNNAVYIQSKRIASNYRVETFGCCGHYIECSDAKRCVMADVDKEFYGGCQYRKNLENGKIFYGKNANIDYVK